MDLNKIKDFLSLYKDDYEAFVLTYKNELEPKLLFIAELDGKTFKASNNIKLHSDVNMNPPALIVTDDWGNTLAFNVQIISMSLEEVKEMYSKWLK